MGFSVENSYRACSHFGLEMSGLRDPSQKATVTE